MPRTAQQLPCKYCPAFLLEAALQVLARSAAAPQAVHEALKACYTEKTSARCSGLN